LAAIARDSGVEAAIEALVPLDPSGGKGATSPALEGRWRLLWSANAGGFSPLLLLPTPVRPTSFQLLGDAAVSDGIGPGRVAQLLLLPFGTVELSSDVVPAPDDTRFLEIFPPFKLQLRFAGRRLPIVEADSDASFRKANVRTAEAQAAPRNRYEQCYLDTSGRAGDIRISRVVEGDPVIVGSVFVHQRV
jgi:hypothetical protein